MKVIIRKGPISLEIEVSPDQLVSLLQEQIHKSIPIEPRF